MFCCLYSIQPVQPAKTTSSWKPSIVLTPSPIDSRGNHRQVGQHHQSATASVSMKMGAINDATEAQTGTSTAVDSESLLNGAIGTNSEKSIALDMAAKGTVDSNNNNPEKQLNVDEPEGMSFHKKDLFQSKSSSPNRCRADSESRPPLVPSFQRSNSVPGFSSSQHAQQLSPRSPHFASSAFYDPQSHPTIEEQVSSL